MLANGIRENKRLQLSTSRSAIVCRMGDGKDEKLEKGGTHEKKKSESDSRNEFNE